MAAKNITHHTSPERITWECGECGHHGQIYYPTPIDTCAHVTWFIQTPSGHSTLGALQIDDVKPH